MSFVIEFAGTITSANGNGSGTLASAGQSFTATISTTGLGADLDGSNGRGFFDLQNAVITLRLTGGTITATQGSFEVNDVVSGSDQLILAAITPFSSVTGGTVSRLYFDFRAGNPSLFSGDQQPLGLLGSSGFASVRDFVFEANSGAWSYQGAVGSVSVTAIPEPSIVALAFGLVAAAIGIRARLWGKRKPESVAATFSDH
jgi:hypothetical protein